MEPTQASPFNEQLYNVQESNFRKAVELLEGMGTAYAIVVPCQDGVFRKVQIDPSNIDEATLVIDGLQSAMDKCKASPLIEMSEMMKHLFKEGESKDD